MNMHIIVLSLLGAIIFGGVLLVVRLRRLRRKTYAHDAVVDRALAQMRQTGIFLSLGLNPDPSDIMKLQTQLQKDWGYDGDIDGIPNSAMLEAIDRMATSQGVDVESEVQNLFPKPRYEEVLPSSVQREIVLSSAKKTLERGHKVA